MKTINDIIPEEINKNHIRNKELFRYIELCERHIVKIENSLDSKYPELFKIGKVLDKALQHNINKCLKQIENDLNKKYNQWYITNTISFGNNNYSLKVVESNYSDKSTPIKSNLFTFTFNMAYRNIKNSKQTETGKCDVFYDFLKPKYLMNLQRDFYNLEKQIRMLIRLQSVYINFYYMIPIIDYALTYGEITERHRNKIKKIERSPVAYLERTVKSIRRKIEQSRIQQVT